MVTMYWPSNSFSSMKRTVFRYHRTEISYLCNRLPIILTKDSHHDFECRKKTATTEERKHPLKYTL